MEKDKSDNLNKKDISKSIYLKFGISISYASKFLEDTINVLIEGLKKDGLLKINKFGSFNVLFKKERIGRNPKNKKTYKIEKRKTVSFKPSSYLKDKLNKNE
tara:strand:+ start:210 stop:515 length:306 start_codon:yes stop_codon:yes gene_type:complete